MAKASGGSVAARNRAKNQEMAARLKKAGDKRESFRCPICNGVFSVASAYTHLAYHPAW